MLNNRTIKFRAWDKENRKMHNVRGLDFENGYIEVEKQGTTHLDLLMEDCELMQYTGLKDKNGVEIWEGDVVKTKEGEYGKLKVIFHQGVFGVTGADSRHYPLRKFTMTGTSISERQIDVEVIGNIYQNKDLL